MRDPRIVSVSVAAAHAVSKPCVDEIELIADVGVRGDAMRVVLPDPPHRMLAPV